MDKDLENIVLDSFQRCFPDWQKGKFIIAVSGGVDSMVLLHILHKIKVPLEVVHCNFNLRGKESDKDQELVEKTCKKLGVSFMFKSFQIDKKKDNVQLKARELRYEWFETLKSQKMAIVLAHHLDDQIETLFLNLMRGTGLKGLTGMKILQNNYFRPLLDVDKSIILNWAKKNKVPFREDASNRENVYSRNRIRNVIIPEFEKIKQDFKATLTENMKELLELEAYLDEELESISLEKKWGYDFISDFSMPHSTYIRLQFLRKYGFSRNEMETVKKLNEFESGKVIISKTHELLRTQDGFLIRGKNTSQKSFQFTIHDNKANTYKSHGWELNLSGKSLKNALELDEAKLNFPLQVRPFQKGDKIAIKGMDGKKKVSDLLSESGIPLWVKESYPVIVDKNSAIVCVPGLRVNKDYLVQDKSNTAAKYLVKFTWTN